MKSSQQDQSSPCFSFLLNILAPFKFIVFVIQIGFISGLKLYLLDSFSANESRSGDFISSRQNLHAGKIWGFMTGHESVYKNCINGIHIVDLGRNYYVVMMYVFYRPQNYYFFWLN